MRDLQRISALAWIERSALELLQLRLHVRLEYFRTQPASWMQAILDEDLRHAYEDAEIARQDLVRDVSGAIDGRPLHRVRDLEDTFEDEAGIWPGLFDEHFTQRKHITTAIRSLEAESEVLGLTDKEHVLQREFLYTNRPALHAVPK